MKKRNKFFRLILTVFMILFFNVVTVRGECSDDEIYIMKKYADNINFSYDYYIENDVAYFNITVNNLVPQLYIRDEETETDYFFEDTVDGELVIDGITKEKGEFLVLSNLDNCFNQRISVKDYVLPSYNKYYLDSICEGNTEHSLCQKWKKTNFTYEEFKKTMEEYKKSKVPKEDEKKEEEEKYELTWLDTLADFYMKYYYVILSAIIIVCITIMIINIRKNKFNL